MPSSNPAIASLHGRAAALARAIKNGEREDTGELQEVRQALAAEKLRAHVAQVLAHEPLNDEQRARVAALLGGAR